VKLLLDEMLDPTIAEQLTGRGHDVEAVQEHAELQGRTDTDLLRAALELGRVMVTDNVQDFARLHQQLIRAGDDHTGILLASPARYPRAKRTIRLWTEALHTYLEGHGKASLANLCEWLP
jgi:predicted nuclease of predicted toxin-antitoxin system